MNIGTEGSNSEPQGKNKMARKSVRMGIVLHDKGDDIKGTIEVVLHDKGDDIKGTIEVIATFAYARSPRPGPPSTQPIGAQLAAGAQCSQSPMTAGEARGDVEDVVTLRGWFATYLSWMDRAGL
jgi:hypothetical protein